MGRLRRKPVAAASSGDGVWQVPARFNFTRDVVEAFAADAVRPALTFVDREGVIDRRTFKEVAAHANRWAALLRARGLVPGDRLLVYVGRTPAWHSILLGALKAGLVAVPCPDTLPAADVALRVTHSGARLVVADDELAQKLAASDVSIDADVVVVEEVAEELRAHSVEQPTHDTAAGDAAFILYTSGTTNDPLGAVHTHGYTWAQRLQAESWLDARAGDLVWCTAGVGTAESIWNCLLGPWSCGVETAMHEADFDVEQRFNLIARLGVTVLCQVPSEYRLMAKHSSLDGFYIGSVRHAVSTGEPLDRAVAAIFHDAFGLTIYDGYGQTENTILVANSPEGPFRPGSMGLPTLGHVVGVVDDEGNEQPVGKEGEIALRGRPPSLFREYWNAPDETRRAFRGDWYITGDRATRDEDGYLWFTGRVGDAILSAAHRINPFEVESALLEHRAVLECLVVGRPVAGRGNLVKALVILRAGVEPSDDLVIELQDHVEAVSAPYKVPREIEFVGELPKTTSGKIRRVELREPEAAGLANAPDTVVGPTGGGEKPLGEVPEDPALEEARRRKKARSAEVAAAAALEAAARAERRVDLERRTAEALAAEQTARKEEAQQAEAAERDRLAAEQAEAAEQARLAAEEAESVELRSRRDEAAKAAEAVALKAPTAEPVPESTKQPAAPTKAGSEQSARSARREIERQRKVEEEQRKETEMATAEQRKRDKAEKRSAAAERKTESERRRDEEKAAAEQARRDEADARRAAAAQAKEDERQRKEDEKRQRDEEKAAAEQARRDEADARRAAAAQAKEDERQRKEDEKRQRDEEKAAAEQARRDEADARRAAEAKAKEDERQRKEDEKRQRDEEKAAAEQARRDEADARRAAEAKAKEDRDAAAAEQRAAKEALRPKAKSKASTPLPAPEADGDADEDRPNPSLLARLSEYGHGKDADDPDPPAE